MVWNEVIMLVAGDLFPFTCKRYEQKTTRLVLPFLSPVLYRVTTDHKFNLKRQSIRLGINFYFL